MARLRNTLELDHLPSSRNFLKGLRSRKQNVIYIIAHLNLHSASLTSIKAGDFDRIVDANDAFFLYLQTFDTTVAEVVS